MMINTLLAELTQEAATTRRVLERLPTDKLKWRPHPKSRTLGELAAHIAMLPANIAAMAAHETFDVSGIPQSQSLGDASPTTVLDGSLASARAALSGMSDERLGEMWSMMAGGTVLVAMPRVALLRSIMLNHWYHHRGQLSVYLRELDVPVPSIYGPSADENPFMP